MQRVPGLRVPSVDVSPSHSDDGGTSTLTTTVKQEEDHHQPNYPLHSSGSDGNKDFPPLVEEQENELHVSAKSRKESDEIDVELAAWQITTVSPDALFEVLRLAGRFLQVCSLAMHLVGSDWCIITSDWVLMRLVLCVPRFGRGLFLSHSLPHRGGVKHDEHVEVQRKNIDSMTSKVIEIRRRSRHSR